MKSIILAVAIMLFSTFVFAEVTMKIDEGASGTSLIFSEGKNELGRQTYDSAGTYITTKGKIPDGSYKVFYKDGKTVSQEFTFKAGQKILEKTFTEEGLLKYEAEYKAGFLDGKKTSYYFKEKIPMLVINYKKGKKDGTTVSYFQNGSVEYEENYKADEKQGKRKAFFVGGTVESEEAYRDDVKDGPWKKYWENGKVRGEALYKNGAPVGVFKSYHDNGKIETEANYKNGVLEGTMRTYDADGKITAEEVYKNNRLVKKIK